MKTKQELFDQWMAIPPLGRFDEYLPGIKRTVKKDRLHMEFGVWKGGSINYIADHIEGYTVHGFDSFKGLPEDWAMNKDGSGLHKKGHFATAIPKVRDNVKLHVGLFQSSLPGFLEQHKEPAGYINIDCDIYSAASFVFTALNERIIPGTIIRFDEICDWRETTAVKYDQWEDGEWRALWEWIYKFNREIEPISRTRALQGTLVVTK